MITVMLSGSISKQPETRISTKGNSYAVATIRTGEGDDAVFASITAFGDLADTLAGMAKGDPLTVIGAARLSAYTGKDGDAKAGLSITASRIMALTDHQAVHRPRGDSPGNGPRPRRESPPAAGPLEFSDSIPF